MFREQLPEGCPPSEANEIVQTMIVYRLARANPPTDNDFRSQHSLRPNVKFKLSECIARGLSVHKDRQDSENLTKLPKFRSSRVCKVTLENGAGRVMQTGKPSHHTWWPYADFDILARCEVVGP